MCADNSSNDGRNATTLYGSCEITYNRSLTQLAKDFPITEVLPKPGQQFLYKPALSHYNEDEDWRINRLEGLHHMMVAGLYRRGQLSAYESVLGMHDRKGVLVLILDTSTEAGDAKAITDMASIAWTLLNEAYIVLVYRSCGIRPRPKPSTPRVPRDRFQPEGKGLWWVTEPGGGHFVE